MGSWVRQVRRLKNFFIAEQYKKARKIIFVVLSALEFLWLIVLFFMEKDYIGGLQIFIGILGVIIAVIGLVTANKKGNIISIVRVAITVIIVALIIIEGRWSLGIARQREESVEVNALKEAESGNGGVVKEVEKNLKSLVLQNDPFLKSLTEYTNEQGSDVAKITAVFKDEIFGYMKKWDILSLGEFGDEYMQRRERIDEICGICLEEVNSKHIKDLAIGSYKSCIGEIDDLNNDYPNPELLKEEAGKCIELGDLYASLGMQSDAADSYLTAINVAWRGVEESIKYGMSKNAKETLETMSMAYKRVETLPQKFDDWDCERASDIGDVLQDLSDSFDDVFPRD